MFLNSKTIQGFDILWPLDTHDFCPLWKIHSFFFFLYNIFRHSLFWRMYQELMFALIKLKTFYSRSRYNINKNIEQSQRFLPVEVTKGICLHSLSIICFSVICLETQEQAWRLFTKKDIAIAYNGMNKVCSPDKMTFSVKGKQPNERLLMSFSFLVILYTVP